MWELCVVSSNLNLGCPERINQVRWKLSLQPQEERNQALDRRSESVVQILEWAGFVYIVFGHVYLLRSRRYVAGEAFHLPSCAAVENKEHTVLGSVAMPTSTPTTV